MCVPKVEGAQRTDGQFRCFYFPMYRGLSIYYACKTSLKKRFANQTSAAHNYCPTKVREAIKVLSCRAQFNVCGEACMFHFGVYVHTNLYRLIMCKAVLF